MNGQKIDHIFRIKLTGDGYYLTLILTSKNYSAEIRKLCDSILDFFG